MKPLVRIYRAALIAAALSCFFRGLGYLPFFSPDSLPKGLEIVSSVFTLEVWAVAWMALGSFFAYCVWKLSLSRVAWALLAGAMTLWGMSFFIGWIEAVVRGEESRSWVSACTYFFPGVIIGLLSSRWILILEEKESAEYAAAHAD